LAQKDSLRITIVTVCRNSETFLAETIESVTGQTYPNLEYIIIDGASTDGTLGIIKQYEPKIDTWVSEPDSGMYEAINKGLQLATGDYILILNSDDRLTNSDTIQEAVSIIGNNRPDYFYGNLIKFQDEKYRKVKLFTVTFDQLLMSTHGTFISHPCFFISAKLNQVLGGYDSSYLYAADYDYILRALAVPGCKGQHIDLFVSHFRLHNNNAYNRALGKINEEREKILTQHGYYQQPRIKRLLSYYTLWIYYKIINLGNRYKSLPV